MSAQKAERLVQDVLDVRRAYVASINNLPTELLSNILSMCCGEGDINLSERTCVPLLLSAVCRTWRATMIGTHTIWASFAIPDNNPKSMRKIFRRLEMFLANSGNVPLRYQIQYSVAILDSRTSHLLIEKCINIDYAGRSRCWDDVVIAKYDMESRVCFLDDSLADCPLSCLTTFTGHLRHFTEGNRIGLFARTPRLRRIELTSTGGPSDVIPHLPWRQLEELQTTSSLSYALELLQLCPKVSKWKHHHPSPIRPGLSVHYNQLTNDDPAVLECLTMPATLEDVTLCWAYNYQVDDAALCVLQRSPCRLRRLNLHCPPRVGNALLGSLQELIEIQLRDTNHNTTRDFLDALAEADTTGVPRLLPRLKALSLGGLNNTFTTAGIPALLAMVEARHFMKCPLQRIMLNELKSSRKVVWDLEQLEALVPDFVIHWRASP